MPYNKYKKIKGSPNSKSPSGLKNADTYVDDDTKTKNDRSTSKDKNPDAARTVSSLSDLDAYAENDMKTINPDNFKHLVSVVNCSSTDGFIADCHAAEQLYHSHKSEHLNPGQTANEGYHIISSCKGTDLDPLLIHQAGIDLARELCGDDFAAKVCTHLNTGNYHNHIIINAYSNDGTHKFKDEYHLYKKIRRISDEISLQYGFQIIVPGLTDKKTWAEYLDGKAGYEDVKAATKEIKQDISECAKRVENYAAYELAMQDKGYTLIKSGKRTSYLKDGLSVSDYRLGTRYCREGIEETIRKNLDRNQRKQAASAIAREARRQDYLHRKEPDLSRIYVPRYDKKGRRIPAILRFLMLLQKYIERIGDTYFDAAAADLFPDNSKMQDAAKKMKRLEDAATICEKYGIRTEEGLADARTKAGMDAKTSDYEALRLYESTDRLSDTIKALKLKKELAAYLNTIGLDDSYFLTAPAAPEEIKKNLAAIDPMTGKQKKQLWNALNESDYRLKDGSFTALSRKDAKEILAFLNGNSGKMPDTLITMSDYNCMSVRHRLEQKARNRAAMLSAEYGNEEATDKQKYAISYLSNHTIDTAYLKKDIAIRLLDQLRDYQPEGYPHNNLSQEDKPTSWMMDTLKELRELKPESFQGIDFTKLSKANADNLINHELAHYDNVREELMHPKALEPPFPKKKPLDLKAYSEENRRCILEYKKAMDAIRNYGLDSDEKVEAFIQAHEDTLAEADTLSAKSRKLSGIYKELNFVSNTIKNAASKSFLYGTLYQGEGAAVDTSKTVLTDDRADRLMELKEQLKTALDELSTLPLSKTSIQEGTFLPLPPHIRELIDTLKADFPEYIPEDIPPTGHLSSKDAYQFLSDFHTDEILTKAIQESERMEQEKKKQTEQEHQADRTTKGGISL